MGWLWRGYGEAMEAMGSYLFIVLSHKLAMGWLWAGYGEAMGSYLFRGCFVKVSWVFRGGFVGDSWGFHGCFVDVS